MSIAFPLDLCLAAGLVLWLRRQARRHSIAVWAYGLAALVLGVCAWLLALWILEPRWPNRLLPPESIAAWIAAGVVVVKLHRDCARRIRPALFVPVGPFGLASAAMGLGLLSGGLVELASSEFDFHSGGLPVALALLFLAGRYPLGALVLLLAMVSKVRSDHPNPLDRTVSSAGLVCGLGVVVPFGLILAIPALVILLVETISSVYDASVIEQGISPNHLDAHGKPRPAGRAFPAPPSPVLHFGVGGCATLLAVAWFLVGFQNREELTRGEYGELGYALFFLLPGAVILVLGLSLLARSNVLSRTRRRARREGASGRPAD
jgi:hypothetical protein